MSYRVRIDSYQGPFDLLLALVSRQKIDIGAISIAEIADQYLAEVERMRDLDLDVASDFLVVAATLLQIKTASLLPKDAAEEIEIDEEFADLTPEQTRDILVERLLTYKQFKNAAAALGMRMENEAKMHPRQVGLEEQFLGLMPDYLKNTTLHSLAVICADITAKRETFLLEAEHIAAVPISMERHVEGIYRAMRSRHSSSFEQLVGAAPTPELIVVTFLAILELYKRGVITFHQEDAFAELTLDIVEDAPEITDFSVPDWGMPDDPSLEKFEDDAKDEEGSEVQREKADVDSGATDAEELSDDAEQHVADNASEE